MATIPRARQICERALRLVGAYSINETAARAAYMDEALWWLDMAQAQLAGTVECFWLKTETVGFDLTAGASEYELKSALGPDWPTEGIEYVTDAWLEDEAGNRYPLEIMRRQDFESVENAADTGQPAWLHINRVAEPTVRTYPVLADESQTWTVKLVIQKQTPIIAGVGPIPKEDAGQSIETSFPAAWSRHLAYTTAADIGNGPVRKLPLQTINDYRGQADRAFAAMEGFSNRERETTPPVTQSMDIC
jgi:hypothetical protein